jgi:serine/threonine protein kinase
VEHRGSLDRLKSILERAAELPAGARRGFLDQECGQDAELRGEVERLLGLHDAAGSFLPSGHGEGTSPLSDLPEGRRIGPYTILEKIGEGGFGTVYLARQDQPIRRNVALKLVRAGASSAQVLARFEAERQVLALMDHPNIAVVYDAGVSEEGDPYFVMEHVAGSPITKYADEERLGVEDRLRLFQQLCEGMQHAHQKGVIHRDLKPSNVLVTRAGEKALVKVIDFGVAKAIGARLTEETLHTQAGVVIGTPEYMSPEQASLSPSGVDTRSDVYSLGVMLYELLVGALPFDRDPEDLLGLLQLIRDKEPPRLTTRLDSLGAAAPEIAARRRTDRQSLARRLRGELESIVNKALEKEPSRRYSSASTLAEDIGRHLGNLPILARSPSTAYQIQKLVARHRGVAAVGAALVAALIFFGVAMSVMYNRQRIERQKTEHINRFLQEMLAAADPAVARGDEVLARDILDRAAAKVSTELADDLEVRDSVLQTLQQAYDGLGITSEAIQLGHLRVNSATQLHGDNSLERAAALNSLADAFLDGGHADSAMGVIDESSAILKGKRSGTPHLAHALSLSAIAFHDLGKFPESEKLGRESVELYRQNFGTKDTLYAGALSTLAVTLEKEGRLEEAEAAQREALAVRKEAWGADHPNVLISQSNLAKLLKMQRKYAEAESLYRETVAVERRVFGGDHPILAKGINNLAVLIKQLERYDEAEPLYQECLAMQRRLFGNDHPDVAASLSNLGALYVKQDRFDLAEQFYRDSMAMWVRLYGQEHVQVAQSKHMLAGLMFSQKKYAEAEALEREAIAGVSKNLAPSHPTCALYRQFLTQVLLKRANYSEARKVMEDCLACQSQATDPDPVALAWSRNLLGQSILRDGNAAAAETLIVGSVETLLADATFARSRKWEAVQATVDVLSTLQKEEEASKYRPRLDELKK